MKLMWQSITFDCPLAAGLLDRGRNGVDRVKHQAAGQGLAGSIRGQSEAF